jgi:hypothetical protein
MVELSLDLLPDLLTQVFGSAAAGYQVLNQQQDYCVLAVQLLRPSIEVIIKLAGQNAIMAAHFARTTLIHGCKRTFQ